MDVDRGIKAFAGEDYERARYYPEDDQYLLAKPDNVEHSDIVVHSLPAAHG